MRDLKGRTVLVTGASSGIGAAACRAFSAQGCRVAMAARRKEKLDSLAQELSTASVDILGIECDIRDAAQARGAVEEVVRRWGALDILVNNAGVQRFGRFHEQDLGELEDLIQTNLLGVVYASHAALRRMSDAGSGHIVNVSSIGGLMGMPWTSVYSASKFAVVGLTEALRREYRGSGVRLSVFCPGTVDTPMAAEPLKDEGLRRTVKPKSAEQAAERIVDCVLKGSLELVYGEVPAFVLRLMRFFPGLADWAVHRSFTRHHPQVRELLKGGDL